MLVTSKEMLTKAYDGKYAVPAINTQGGTYDIIRAICLAAEEMKSPVILAHYVKPVNIPVMTGFMKQQNGWPNKVCVPVAIHLDHGDTFEHCVEMLNYGFTSIMYDGSKYSLEENAARTEEVTKYAHAIDIPVEAEIGELARLDDNGNIIECSNIADVDNVKKYLESCHPDSLAIGIGNAHGFYKGPVDIKVDILRQCREFTDIPFVLHGCTGMDEALIQRAIRAGVAKINFGTQVRCQFVEYLKEGLAEGKDEGHAWKLSRYAEERLRRDIKEIIRLAGSQGRA